MSNDREGNIWVDVAATHYPRLLSPEEAAAWHGGYTQQGNDWSFHCVHIRTLGEPCVACEGLSILEHTRR